MASDNKEIEIKIKIDKSTYEHLFNKLFDIAEYLGKTQQKDDYYSPVKKSYISERYPFKWLSIRTRGKDHVLNYKHFYPEGAERHSHCDEFETKISSPKMIAKIFSELEIEHLVCVNKIRHKFIYQDRFEIVLDSVDELGYFIEIESIMQEPDVETVRKEIMSVVSMLGLKTSDIDYRGYPYDLMKEKGLL